MAQLFAITITPRARATTPKYQYEDDKKLIARYMNRFSHHYGIYPETAPMTGRLHYHGIVSIYNMPAFSLSKKAMDRDIGFVKITKILNSKGHLQWLMYCMKEWGYNRHHFKEPIMYQNLRRKKEMQRPSKPSVNHIMNAFNQVGNNEVSIKIPTMAVSAKRRKKA